MERSQDKGDPRCWQDQAVRTLKARFSATVTRRGEEQIFEGLLLVRRPGALRVKLFGFGGLTVHDALWVGGAEHVRAWIQQPFSGPARSIELSAAEGLDHPEAELSRVLWSLWQPRCDGEIPKRVTRESWSAVDEEAGQLLRREIWLGPDGIEQERLELPTVEGRPETIQVRYGKRQDSASALPGWIEMDSSAREWRAAIGIVALELNPALDDQLFALPDTSRRVQ